MFNRDKWNEILEVLTSNWVRTLLTAFGVFWGIFILILLLAAGKGLENGTLWEGLIDDIRIYHRAINP